MSSSTVKNLIEEKGVPILESSRIRYVTNRGIDCSVRDPGRIQRRLLSIKRKHIFLQEYLQVSESLVVTCWTHYLFS